MKCFYHTDMDGHCAGAIVYLALGEGDYRSINYNQQFPFEDISEGETVVIVDFSLQKDGDFEKLLNITKNIIWIDHHKTAIAKHLHISEEIQGYRKDGISGCELTWEYFFPNLPKPEVVKLLGDYDIWEFKYGEDTNKLQTGIRLYDTHPKSPEWKVWLKPDYIPNEEIKLGEIALKYRDNYYRGLVKAWSFPTIFEGYNSIACNAGSVSSQLFDTIKEEYDIMIPFVFDGEQWTVSLYTKNKDIDVSELAIKYGGGGHKKAAGFQCKELPFHKNL